MKRLLSALLVIAALLMTVVIVFAATFYWDDEFDYGDVTAVASAEWQNQMWDAYVLTPVDNAGFKAVWSNETSERYYDVYVCVVDYDSGPLFTAQMSVHLRDSYSIKCNSDIIELTGTAPYWQKFDCDGYYPFVAVQADVYNRSDDDENIELDGLVVVTNSSTGPNDEDCDKWLK